MIKKTTLKIALYHLIGVLSFILFELVVLFFHETHAYLWEYAIFYGIDILFFYISAYLFIQIIKKQKIKIDFRFAGYSLLWVLLFTFIDMLFTYIQYSSRGMVMKKMDIAENLTKLFCRFFYFYLLAYGFWAAKSLVRRERENRDKDVALLIAENEKSRFEIALLRSQIMPHLMLNTLSGVHSLVMSSNPKAAVLVELLIDNLRVSLKGSDPDQVTTLGEELQLVKNIVRLYEQLGKPNCKLDIALAPEMLKIEFPVNLISTLVENVFKHGDLHDPELPAVIDISHEGLLLMVSICNKYRAIVNDEKMGIGIDNIRRRLNIQFNGRYDLRIEKNKNTYNTHLNIKLLL
ncbi:MAG: hypothetical protein BGO31_20785 [Bacteroidetes bacterium 43-16]|uniref:sensor histidine kinase n=1 Tax=uncultured Dysgonomonas sp. TaxID=206096 RepID=UPI00092C3CA6|nr:histidine kinase [uncultured Dysgonomonas sp.]OJV55368.1 MAG: hypothetical protein BGO31_20785 [Bacteroidetes bacterium 43-16]